MASTTSQLFGRQGVGFIARPFGVFGQVQERTDRLDRKAELAGLPDENQSWNGIGASVFYLVGPNGRLIDEFQTEGGADDLAAQIRRRL